MERHMAQAANKRTVVSGARERDRKVARHGGSGRFLIASLMDERGAVKVDHVADAFRMSKAQLAETAGLAREVFQKSSRRDSPKHSVACARCWRSSTWSRVGWWRRAGHGLVSRRAHPGLRRPDCRGAGQVGNATAVRDYVDHLATGGYA